MRSVLIALVLAGVASVVAQLDVLAFPNCLERCDREWDLCMANVRRGTRSRWVCTTQYNVCTGLCISSATIKIAGDILNAGSQ